MVYHRTLNIAIGNSWLSPSSSCRRARTAYHCSATKVFTSLSLFMMFFHLVMPTPSALFLSFLLSHFLYFFCQEALLNSLHAPLGLPPLLYPWCWAEIYVTVCVSSLQIPILILSAVPVPTQGLLTGLMGKRLGSSGCCSGSSGCQDISGWDSAERVWVVGAQHETLGDLEAWMLI